MNLKELDSFRLSDAVSFHNVLNPRLWDGETLKSEVKDQLLLIAKDFLEELGVSDLDVVDVTISGSNAAYSYTPHSDLDLHIIVNLSKLDNNEVYTELFNAKKTLYNDSHHITVHGVPVELYVQDSRDPVISLGEYSILNDQWIKMPTKRRANLDQTLTKSKYEKLVNLVKLGLKYKDIDKVNNLLKTIRRYRQAGLDKGGEFSPENLAYKILRKQGYIDRLYQLRDKLHSEELTIEDYDPNGPPPGPEFKPTMPKGTVRVDVSDVYDWYKLGQHISNLKGLGHHDFGKGPPSTIMAFGSEPEEHKYIKDLEKTGLTTTDIDPIDINQPKGMKRQKVDPTYNVNEVNINLDDRAEEYRNKLLNTLPQIMKLFANVGKGWSPSKEQLLAVVDTGYQVMKHTGDVKQASKAVIDELNTLYKINQGQQGVTEDTTITPKIGINIRSDGNIDYASLIVDGKKKYESRRTDSLRPYVGKTVGIVRTGNGPAVAIGQVTIGEPIIVDVEKFNKLRNQHLVPQGSKFDIESDSTKYLYPMIDPVRWDNEKPIKSKGIVSRKIQEQGVTEAFDQPYKLKWEKGEFGDYDALAMLDDGTNLSIMFNKEDDDSWMVEFWRGASQSVTGEGDAQRIFATVLYAIEKFIKKEKPNSVTFSASKEVEPGQNAQSRARLYDRLVQRYAKALGYRSFRAETGSTVHYELSRIKRSVAEDETLQFASEKTPAINPYGGLRDTQFRGDIAEASGYIPNEKEKNDPRFKTALTVDVRPNTMKSDAKRFGNKISRAGIPPTLKANGKF